MKVLQSRPAHRIIAAAAALALSSTVLHPRGLLAQAPPAVTAADAKDYEAAEKPFNEGRYKEAAALFEKFLEKYGLLSPKSLDAKYRIAIAYAQTEHYDEAVGHLRQFIANQRVALEAKAMAQLLIAKTLTLKAFKLPSETDGQRTLQKKFFAEAIKEYDTFIISFPKSRDLDNVYFLRAQVLLQSGDYDEALKGFGAVMRIPNSPFTWEAAMWIGKTYFIQANSLLEIKGGKDPKPEDVQKALALFDKSLPFLDAVANRSGDLALQNEAVFLAAQMQLTRIQHVIAKDEEQKKQRQEAMLRNALESFRKVRSVEEVVEEQDRKIRDIEQRIKNLVPGPDYHSNKTSLEALLSHEQEKKEKLKAGQDLFLSARLAIARIFLELKQPDEARTSIGYIQGQKELVEKDRDAQASMAALLCLTYAEQKKAEKALETYQAFREKFKGNPIGENLPYVVASVLVGQGKTDQAEQIVGEGQADYKDWRFAMESNQVLIAAAQKRGEYDKALSLCEKVLSQPLNPDVEAWMRYLKGNVQNAIAIEKKEPAMADKAVETYKVQRDKFADSPLSEDAWFSTCQILAASDRAKAIVEMEKFLGKFAAGGGKSDNTGANLPIIQYKLGNAFRDTNQYDKAVTAWRKVIDAYPKSEPAPDAFFRIFDIYYNEKKNYGDALKLMEEFLQKYPKHEKVYFAYVKIAEFLFAGTLDARTRSGNPPAGKAAIANIEAGAKKLIEYLEYEKTANLETKRGDDALIRIADRWLDELRKLRPDLTQNPDQRAMWDKAVEGVTGIVERLLKDYPASGRVSEALARLVSVQNARRRAQQADIGKIEAYFQELATKFGATPLLKSKIEFALASILQDPDPKRAFTVMDEAFRAVSKPVTEKTPDGKQDRIVQTFLPADWDRYLAGLFEAKRLDDVTKVANRVRLEYPLDEKADPRKALPLVQEGQAVAIFWEAKVLLHQGKAEDAGAKFNTLKKAFPKSTKKLEADYGIILGEFERTGKAQPDYYERLNTIISTQTGRSFELQANALFLVGRLLVADKELDGAIAAFEKIQLRYAIVPKVAAEGLWRAAEIAEKQAKGDRDFPVRTIREKKAAAEARAAAAAAAPKPPQEKSAEAKATDTKSADTKSAEAKPDDVKSGKGDPAPEKPAGKTAAPAGAPQK